MGLEIISDIPMLKIGELYPSFGDTQAFQYVGVVVWEELINEFLASDALL
jgi:hypothetical protein